MASTKSAPKARPLTATKPLVSAKPLGKVKAAVAAIVPGAVRPKLSQQEVPAHSLAEATRIAETLYLQFAGDPTAPHRVATALDLSQSSSRWRMLSGAAIAFGLVGGGAQAEKISLTALGRRVVAPREEGDDLAALREAAMKPKVLSSFFTKYNSKSLPNEAIAKNVLIDEFGVPRERVDSALVMVLKTGRDVGFIEKTKTGEFVSLDAVSSVGSPPTNDRNEASESHGDFDEDTEDELPVSMPPTAVAPLAGANRPVRLFLGHGSSKEALNQLKSILTEFRIDFAVAEEEAHAGRPISQKIADAMHECTGGVLSSPRTTSCSTRIKSPYRAPGRM